MTEKHLAARQKQARILRWFRKKNRADFIEKMHAGSTFDHYFGTPNGAIKLVCTSVMSLALFVFSITGFWLWYGPKRIRKY